MLLKSFVTVWNGLEKKSTINIRFLVMVQLSSWFVQHHTWYGMIDSNFYTTVNSKNNNNKKDSTYYPETEK